MSTPKKNAFFVRMIGSSINTLSRISPKTAGRVAFDLFCTPRKKVVKPEEIAFLATADRHTEVISGNSFAVYHWGFKGPIVLLAHGWESHSGRWRKVAPLLVQAGYQVVAVDAPAHGRSSGRRFTMIHYAEVLRTLYQRLGPIDTVIGHSVGGAAALWALGTASPAMRPKKAVIMAAFSTLDSVFEQARTRVGISGKAMQLLHEQFEHRFKHPVSYFSIERVAAQLGDVRGLLIHDRKDAVTSHTHSAVLAAAWPNVQLITTDGYGHGLTAPKVIETILDFVLDPVYHG
jgi:pimeloyl-ACP methyl ester carboxylesterase